MKHVLALQRRTGSAFAYSSFFPRKAVTAMEGEYKLYRRVGESGLAVDSAFCPTCGVMVFVHLGAMPDAVCVPVGCFADPEVPPPQALCWSTHKHRWLEVPPDVRVLLTQ